MQRDFNGIFVVACFCRFFEEAHQMMMIICFFDCVMLMQLKNSVCISNQQGVVYGAATVCDLLFEKGIRIGLQQQHTLG